jgi:probable rRNA maturation factor
MILTLNIIKSDRHWRSEEAASKKRIKVTAQEALKLFPELASIKEIEVSILLTDNQQMQDLNHQFRSKNKPTNVLSFPDTDIPYVRYTKEKDYLLEIDPRGDYINLGDIAFGYEIIKEEAQKQDKKFDDHFAHLLIHGLLHLLGFDHEEALEAEIMENLEIKALSNLSIASPY